MLHPIYVHSITFRMDITLNYLKCFSANTFLPKSFTIGNVLKQSTTFNIDWPTFYATFYPPSPPRFSFDRKILHTLIHIRKYHERTHTKERREFGKWMIECLNMVLRLPATCSCESILPLCPFPFCLSTFLYTYDCANASHKSFIHWRLRSNIFD